MQRQNVIKSAKNLMLKPLRKELFSFHSFVASEGQKECHLFDLSIEGMKLYLLGIDNL